MAAFTQGEDQPSARFRVRQCLGKLVENQVLVTEFVARFGAYPPARSFLRLPWASLAVLSRLPDIARSRSFDVVWLQRELLSTLPTLEGLTGRPRVFDVDDAIWLRSRFGAADRIARSSDAVICGNTFLAEHFRGVQPRVHVVPTSVDTERFGFRSLSEGSRLVIGWSGSSSGLQFLRAIEPPLRQVLDRFPQAVLRVVADRPPELPLLSGKVEFLRWAEDTEVSSLQSFDVGLMPLPDNDWSRGKCSFKMLTYMATGTPVVATPVGMNAEVLAKGTLGLAASTMDDWVDALTTLLSSLSLRQRLGQVGREVVEREFSTSVVASRIAEIFRSVAK